MGEKDGNDSFSPRVFPAVFSVLLFARNFAHFLEVA